MIEPKKCYKKVFLGDIYYVKVNEVQNEQGIRKIKKDIICFYSTGKKSFEGETFFGDFLLLDAVEIPESEYKTMFTKFNN